jgi:hypothetical protein
MKYETAQTRQHAFAFAAIVLALSCGLSLQAQVKQKPAPPAGVDEVCSIAFDKDALRPARVENSALTCLK